MKSRKNPYASKLKKPVTMRLGEDVINYFKSMAEDSGIPYQSLKSGDTQYLIMLNLLTLKGLNIY
jgi:predicted DNA binding CopG/RHH family protein